MHAPDAQLRWNGWLSRYRVLAERMDAARRHCRALSALGISTLSPRHPLPPDQLQLMDGRQERPPSVVAIARRWIRCALFAARESLYLFVVRLWGGRHVRRLSRTPALVILKTWCFGPDSVKGPADFYYGTLPQQLQARGVSALLLCGDVRGRLDLTFVDAVLRRRDIRAIPEALLIPWWAPLVTVCRQLATALRLQRLAQRTTDAQLASVCAVAAANALRPITLRNTLQFYIARTAVRRWRARVFVTFYEGQPWERPAWHGAKAANPSCITVGYQHTIVMPYSLALIAPNRDSWERSAPEVVLCLGEIPRAMMAREHRHPQEALVTFGTFRRAPTQGRGRGPAPHHRRVLVLPEGNPTESQVLFNFAMRAAAAIPDHSFVFRCHPLLPFEQVRSLLDEVPERLPNVELSQQETIAADFDRSSVVLYRGSSAVLYAVLHGLKPIYLHAEGYPDIDPLFELTDWREWVGAPGEMRDALHRYAAINEDAASGEWARAATYVESYTQPVDDASVDRLLEAVGFFTGKAGV